jgi:hypothetical protein
VADNVQFRINNSTNAAPKTESFLDLLHEALEGGKKTFEFFKGDMSALHKLAKQIRDQQDGAWQRVDQGSALGHDFVDPNTPAYVANVDDDKQVIVQVHSDDTAMQQDSSDDFKVVGVGMMYVVHKNSLINVVISDIEKLGPGIVGIALLPAVSTLLGAFRQWIQTFITRLYTAAEAGEEDALLMTSQSAEVASEEAAIDGEIIAEELTISVSFGPLAVVGLVVAAITIIISVLLFFLAKTMNCIIRFYNVTDDQQLSLSVCFQHDIQALQQPAQGVIVPPISTPTTPFGPALQKVITRVDYVFQNDSSIEGLGVVIQSPANGNFQGLSFMIDIPSIGDNSIWSKLKIKDCDDIWDNEAGEHKTKTFSDKENGYKLSMATNQLSGQSDSPLDGTEGYYYEFLIVLEQDN